MWYNIVNNSNYYSNFIKEVIIMMKKLQNLGKALMQPVAILPVAALLMGIGYWLDPSGWGSSNIVAAFLIKTGSAILDNLGIIFAVGVAYGLSKDRNGAAGLSGLVAFLIATTLLSSATVAMFKGVDVSALAEAEGWQKMNNGNVFVGIIAGVVASFAYNKFYQVKLPDAFAFFSGRRLTPIMTSLFMIVVSAILYIVWPILFGALVAFGKGIQSLGAVGAGIYAFFNRLLIPTGLHHALNSVFWFNIAGINDIPNFLGGAASIDAGTAVKGITGMYQAGFFPVMMFGLPGAALAMYQEAKPSKKKLAKSLLLAAAFASFFTGVTEPLEFSFMFLAPTLYAVHALLTGVSVAIAAAFHWTAGFGFSAGFVDYFLSLSNPVANNPWMLIPLGLVFFVIYYLVFRFFIRKFNLKTPGREDDDVQGEQVVASKNTGYDDVANIIIEGLGGNANIENIDYCSTRLRASLYDGSKVSEVKIKEAKVLGFIKPDKNSAQIIIGPQVQFVYDKIHEIIGK